jgi:hypothetical protein
LDQSLAISEWYLTEEFFWALFMEYSAIMVLDYHTSAWPYCFLIMVGNFLNERRLIFLHLYHLNYDSYILLGNSPYRDAYSISSVSPAEPPVISNQMLSRRSWCPTTNQNFEHGTLFEFTNSIICCSLWANVLMVDNINGSERWSPRIRDLLSCWTIRFIAVISIVFWFYHHIEKVREHSSTILLICNILQLL